MANKVIASEMPTSPFIDNAEVLGKLIKAKRTGVGLKQADFAETCGTNKKLLTRLLINKATVATRAFVEMVMSKKSPIKPKLVHSKQPEPRPKPGTPEFDAWLLKRAKERAAEYFTDDFNLGDDERGILAGGYDRLLMSDEELAEEEEAMERAQKQERRKHLKPVNKSQDSDS